MPRCAAAGRTSAVPTTVRGPSLYAVSGVNPEVAEIWIANTGSAAMAVGLARATTTGTQGAGLTEVSLSDPAYTPLAQAFQTHTADPTVGAVFWQTLVPALGSVVIAFPPGRLRIPAGTSNGLVIVCPTGTAQQIDFAFIWDE